MMHEVRKGMVDSDGQEFWDVFEVETGERVAWNYRTRRGAEKVIRRLSGDETAFQKLSQVTFATERGVCYTLRGGSERERDEFEAYVKEHPEMEPHPCAVLGVLRKEGRIR